MRIYAICLLLMILLGSCGIYNPRTSFDEKSIGRSPDYSNSYYWASLPFKQDLADLSPKGIEINHIPEEVDVFFIHPTTYFGHKKDRNWNANMDDAKVNESTDEGSIKFQASIFNQDGRVFAPRYRQAHYYSFFTKDKISSQKAYDLAYEDIYNAFLYYYDHWNQGRPIIIAAHSQGALMAIRLLKQVFDNTQMKSKLVVAYVVGFPVPEGTFKYIKVCSYPQETSCICSWRTYKKGYSPKWLENENPALVTNPLSWTTDQNVIPKSNNLGMVIDMEKEPIRNAVSAQIYKNILWSSKPKFPGSFLLIRKNYHKGDFNLYYMNVRDNVRTRIRSYYK